MTAAAPRMRADIDGSFRSDPRGIRAPERHSYTPGIRVFPR